MTQTRKGIRRRADISPSLLSRLNRGETEALTLSEMLAVDFAQLLKNAFPELDPSLVSKMRQAKETGWLERTRLAGALLYQGLGTQAFKKILRHPSDQVRGWGAALVAAIPDLAMEERLEWVRPLANDPNPGPRETAWLMIRPYIAADIQHSIKILCPWTEDPEANIRRFASEITRPRGVWCTHIQALRKNPKPGLILLEPLRADPSRYVQNSVANWLNDASKDHPAFVKALCQNWQRRSKTKETAYICKRALRTLTRKTD